VHDLGTDKRTPGYDELPVHEGLGLRHSWQVWDAADDLGTVNRITDATVLDAVKEVRTGRRFNLSLPLNLPDPPMFGRQPYQHHVLELDRNTYDDYVDGFYTQSSSQWDSLLHIRAGRYGLYKGRMDPRAHIDAGGAGLEAVTEHGLVARGVLLDVAAYLAAVGTPVLAGVETRFDRDILEATIQAQGVALRAGDVLMIRTGWMSAYLAADARERARLATDTNYAGLHAGEDMARFLWNSGAAAVVADNPSLESSPGSPQIGFLHRRLIPMLGFAIGELWSLDALATACAQDGRYACCLVSVPLNLPGAIGSPGNAVAIR
jgi:kynurenine formamidase